MKKQIEITVVVIVFIVLISVIFTTLKDERREGYTQGYIDGNQHVLDQLNANKNFPN